MSDRSGVVNSVLSRVLLFEYFWRMREKLFLPQAFFKHLGYHRTGISSNGFYALGLKDRFFLIRALILESRIAFLCYKHTGMIHLYVAIYR